MLRMLAAAGTACLLLAAFSGQSVATTIGNIQACYDCFANYNQTFAPGVDLSDGVGFSFTNTTAIDITNGVFSIGIGGDNTTADSFQVGTIAGGTTIYVIPGISNDGATGHTFFAFTGSALDTSDVGPNSDDVPFQFTGIWAGLLVDTGIFTPGATAGPSNDGMVTYGNFLGGPGDNDTFVDFFGPKIIAEINTPLVAAVPEPASLALLGTALLGFSMILIRRRRRM